MHKQILFTGPDGSCEDMSISKIVILPVAYDKTSTWIKGAEKGPKAILEASVALELFDIETRTEVYKQGIFTLPVLEIEADPEKMAKQVETRVSELLNKDKFVVTIGGEHSVSIGAISAVSKSVDNLTVLQLDAHSDLRDIYEGSKYNHACVMARVAENNKFVQVGIRSMDIGEKDKISEDRIFYAHDIFDNDFWIEKASEKLSENVYITIDLDVFDPAIMPSTGTPEPGGLDWYKVINFLKTVSEKKNIVGFDVVELCPNEYNKAPDFLAAKLIYKLLSYMFK